jgi:hypothetical protein
MPAGFLSSLFRRPSGLIMLGGVQIPSMAAIRARSCRSSCAERRGSAAWQCAATSNHSDATCGPLTWLCTWVLGSSPRVPAHTGWSVHSGLQAHFRPHGPAAQAPPPPAIQDPARPGPGLPTIQDPPTLVSSPLAGVARVNLPMAQLGVHDMASMAISLTEQRAMPLSAPLNHAYRPAYYDPSARGMPLVVHDDWSVRPSLSKPSPP